MYQRRLAGPDANRDLEGMSGAREAQGRQAAAVNNASPTRSASAIARSLKIGRSNQDMSGANASPIGRSRQHMVILAAIEIVIVLGGVLLYIWRLQFTFPDCAIFLLAFIVVTFLLHRDRLQNLGIGSHDFMSGLKALRAPTLIIGAVLVLIGAASGGFGNWSLNVNKVQGLGRYFAWCLFQQFGLQSFFTNRLLAVFRQPNRTAWICAAVFASFHIPNPVLLPVTFIGGFVLTRVFIAHRNLVPLAIAQAIVGSLLSVAFPASWHHGLRVGPGYYGFH